MERKRTRTVTVLLAVLAVTIVGTAAPTAAQTAEDIQTTLQDTDGDGLNDTVEVEVTVSGVQSGQTTVGLGESDFDVTVSSTSSDLTAEPQFVTYQDTDDDGDNESVEFTSVGDVEGTYTVVADLSNQADGDTGSVNVTFGGGGTGSAVFAVSSGNGGDDNGDGSSTDGESDDPSSDDDGQDTDSAPNSGNGTGDTDGNTDDTDEPEGLPGFTGTVAVLALLLFSAYYRTR